MRAATGLAVRFVFPKSPAAEAGIQPGDILVAAAGASVNDAESLRLKLADRKPGDRIEFEIRRGAQTRKLSVALGKTPEGAPAADLPPSHAEAPARKGHRVGTVELKISDSENKAWAYVPDDYSPSVRHGVVLWLGGKTAPDEKDLIARWKPSCDRHDLILVVPKMANPRRWTSRDLSFVKRLLGELRVNYTIDPARIVVGGQEEGGMIGYLLAFRQRPLVRAVVAVDAPLPATPPDNEPVHPLAFYLARSKKSKFAEPIDKAIARLREMQYPVTVQELGDEPRELSAEELAALARWIDALDAI